MNFRTTSPRFALSAIAASLLTMSAPAFAASDVVISQVYGAGGNSGALLKNDFVELFNRSAAPINLAGWSVQYASATGTGSFSANSPLALPNVTLQPGQYFLVQLAGGTTGASLPAADAAATSPNMSGTAGKVILANVATGLACNGSSTPCSAAQQAQIVDLVGYGSANYYEGSAAAPVLTNTTAAIRTNACTDTDNNGADFSAVAPNPRNTATPLAPCGGGTVNAAIVPTCPATTVAQGTAGSIVLTATDADSRVNAATLAAGTPAAFSLGTLTSAIADGDTASVTLNVDSSLAAGSYPVVVNFGNDDAQNASCTVNVTVTGITAIHTIQGNGAESPLKGQNVTTQGVVTKLLNNGFFMQDEAPDSDPTTSEGIFVFTSTAPTVAVGNRVRLSATVTEYQVGTGSGAIANPLTELTGISGLSVLATDISIAPTVITFPEASEGDLEHYEGMLVRIEGTLTVGQNFFLGRFGQLTVSAGGRLEKPTNRYPAGSLEALAMADDNARRRILLDDGSSLQNPNPTPYLAADNTVRAGDTIAGITGVIDYGLATSSSNGLSDYRIHPTVAPVFTRANARTGAPDAVGGNIKVASFNVLNYFTTLDATGSAGCFPGGSRSDCRGADSALEFSRQKAKIVNAIKALNADVVGLMEIENNGNIAVLDLVNGLNTVMGAGTYASVAMPGGGTGTDAIRMAMIYKPAAVNLFGQAISDTNPIHNRPPLIQTFAAANGEKFSVVVNHFKSKGSCPTSGSDADQGDGQGCWNDLRTQQAQALRNTVQSLQASSGDSDVIVIGDLNAYGKEDPILDFTDAGYIDQIRRFDSFGYSYVFDGEAGYLDHALATPSLSAQITGARHWRINADEPAIIDYNTEFKQPACATCGPDYYSDTVYRSSDHDPVIIGLNLLKQIGGTAGRDILVGTPGDDVITGGIGADTLTGGAGADQFVFTSLRDGVDTITDFQPGVDRIVLTQLLQSVGITITNPITGGYITCKMLGGDAMIGIDPDAAGSAVSRNLVLLKNQNCAVAIPGNFVF
ncbi:MAG: ExeM/NucH family extracellular endonuclease [Azonexus sp.]|nr:ExeM/NucH family extracellular endonuclease [Azonexus sp.]